MFNTLHRTLRALKEFDAGKQKLAGADKPNQGDS